MRCPRCGGDYLWARPKCLKRRLISVIYKHNPASGKHWCRVVYRVR